MCRFGRTAAIAVGGILLGLVNSAHATPPLANSSFEVATDLSGPDDFASWTEFGPNSAAPYGNIFQEPLPRTGSFSIKMFSNFTGSVNLEGVFQDLPAVPGEQWTASVYARHNTGDAIFGTGNRALLKLEFLSGTFSQLSASELAVLDGSTPANNAFAPFSIGGTAPASTAFARITLAFEGDAANSGGAVYFDDAALVPEPMTAGLALVGLTCLVITRRLR
jgi:hypothetical protein